MRYSIRVQFTTAFLFWLMWFGCLEAQVQFSYEFNCGFIPDSINTEGIINTPILNDNLKVGLLLVQFADWQTNIDARGSVGWGDDDPLTFDPIYDKYRYDDYWNLFFSFGTYIDPPLPNDPILHPDIGSHGPDERLRIYGSFTDYWWEVSHKNLRIQAAETHPGVTDPMFRSGIINNFQGDVVQWITLDNPKSDYDSSASRVAIDAIAKAQSLFNQGQLDVDITDTDRFDKIIISFAGKALTFSMIFQGRYTISEERLGEENSVLVGFGVQAHEFGHLLGFIDVHGIPATNGVGEFSLMGRGTWTHRHWGFSPSHVDPWHKLQKEWLDYEIVKGEPVNYTLQPVSDTVGTALPRVAILKGRGTPGQTNWTGSGLEYFILENRSVLNFDRALNYGDVSFDGGMVLWQYAGDITLPNSLKLRVIEADANATYPDGNMALIPNTPGSNRGETSDFFPGSNGVTEIDEQGIPNLQLANGDLSHLALRGITYNSSTNEVKIDSIRTTIGALAISGYTVWSGNTTIDRDVIVLNGGHLEIAPGAVITVELPANDKIGFEFLNGSQFTANGTAASPILIQSQTDASDSDWEGIAFDPGVTIQMDYITIRNAETGVNLGSNAFSRQQFADWHFEKCQTAVNAIGLINVIFTDLRLTDIPSSGGIGAIFNGQNYTLTAAQLTNSSLSLSGSGVNLDGCVIDNSQVSVFSTNNTSVIKTSTFRNDAFLDIHTSAIQVNNNRFESESYLKITGGLGGTLNPVIRNNVMDGGNPVSLKAITLEFASPEITNNTIAYYRNSIDVIGTADPVVKHNIFYQNEFNPPLNGTFEYNNFYDISNDNVPNGGGNIEIDPFFVDPANGDFRLIWGSPMIDAGDPAEPFDSDGTIADIGALFYDQTPITMAVNHPSGWDLVSLPVGSDPVYYLDMFPLAITNTLFSYNGAYQLEDSLQLGTGYWLNLSQSGSSNPVAGIDITALALDLTAGWQFIPGISSSVPVGSIIDPANILNSIFGWNGAYVSVTSLEPGKAYWVNALASGGIVLAANSGPLQKSGDPAIADLDSANWMRFTNNAGNEFTVFFGIDIDSAGQRVFSLPPVPLDSVLNSDGLDVRFTGNFYAADTSGIIEVRTAAYPLTVEYQIEDSTDWNFT